MIVAMFAGIFGRPTLAILFIGINIYAAYLLLGGSVAHPTLLSIILAGELPIIVSYILWHGKASSEKTKDRAYYDLANELDQVANKSDVVISAISDGVVAINNKGAIELINPAAQRLVGWGHQDAIGLDYKSVLQLIGNDGHELTNGTDPIFDVLTTNQPLRRNDLQVQTSSGKKLPVELVISPIGRLGSGAIIVFRDITKEQADEKAQAEFISTASHEMRTPVASIEGYLGLALNPATATVDEKARDFITKAHEAAQHLGRLFQDLLDVTKADDGRLSNNPKVIDVVQYTNDIVEGLRAKADEKQLRLFFKPTTDGGMRSLEPVFFADLDADHFREVIANLVENAIKYTPEGEVIIDVQGDDSHVVISIADSGIGIPQEDIPHLFQKFYRVDNTDTREIGGTGLGLYLCRRLVEAMSGRIWVESEYKRGSTFFVEVPRISHEEANRIMDAASGPGASVQTIEVKPYLKEEEGSDTPTDAQKATALATPIILNHSSPAAAPATPVAAPSTPAPVQTIGASSQEPPAATIDPLVNAPATTATAAAEPLHPHNGMVLPPDLQAVEANVQIAPHPAEAVSATERPLAVPER